MCARLIVVAGDKEYAASISEEHGGGWGYITVTNQDFVYVAGKRVVPKGQMFTAHCSASAGALSTGSGVVSVAGTPVCLNGDVSSSNHSMSGITVIGQDFVFAD